MHRILFLAAGFMLLLGSYAYGQSLQKTSADVSSLMVYDVLVKDTITLEVMKKNGYDNMSLMDAVDYRLHQTKLMNQAEFNNFIQFFSKQ